MNASVRRLSLQWPNTVDAAHRERGLRTLAACGGTPLIVELHSIRPGLAGHAVHVDEHRAPALTAQLRSAVPGIGIEAEPFAEPFYTHAVELRLSTPFRSLRTDLADSVGRSVITTIARVGRDEALSLAWKLERSLKPMPVASTAPISTEPFIESLVRAPFAPPRLIDTESRTALRSKRSEPGWRALGRIAVRATSDARARQLIGAVVDSLRTAEAPGVQLEVRRLRQPNRWPHRAPLRLNLHDLAAVCAWPTGTTADLPVLRLGSRRLPAAAAVAREGRSLGLSTWPGPKRPLALSVDDSTRHLLALAPTGAGKSTMALGLISADMEAGRSVVVIDPSGDLVNDVLQRVPKRRLADVVYLNPLDDHAVVGLNPLHGELKYAELRADQLLNTFHSLYAASWGPRTSDILQAALLTLARTPGMSLPAVPLLLTDRRFRQRLLHGLDDPLGLGPFWAEYESWSDAERSTNVAPVLRRLRPFLVRPRLRHLVGQATPRFDLGDVFTKQRIVLINLARGELGPEAADLLAALALSSLWQHAQGRAARPVQERPLVSIVLEEFPTYLALPVDLGDALARGRALGLSFTLIAQHLDQLDRRPGMKAAVLANARSQVCFQLAPKDAAVMAGTSPLLGAEDFAGLERFHFYARLLADAAVQPWCSGMTLPASPPTIDGDLVMHSSRGRFGVAPSVVDAELTALFQPSTTTPTEGSGDFGPRRRRSGGAS